MKGRFSKEEKEYVQRMRGTRSIADIAIDLNRSELSVRNHIRKLPEKKAEENVNELESTAYWHEIKQQFDDNEIRAFSDEYRGYVDQFRGEVLHSEQIQILDAIKLGLLASRKIKQERALIDEAEEHDRELQALKARGFKQPEDYKRMDDLEHLIAMNRQQIDSLYKSYKDLLNEKAKVMKDLKATRGQREDISISAFKTSFKDWMKRLIEDRAFRAELGLFGEKHRLATEKEYERLSQPHTYMDGNQDLPIMNSNTVKGTECQSEEVLVEQEVNPIVEE